MSDIAGNPKASRRLAAILAADIAGYSALMGANEEATVGDLKGHQTVILPMIADHGGRVIDTAGDGILAEFASVVNAVECAVAMQKIMAERNSTVDSDRQMRFRIGINLGDVIHDETRVYGDGVNIAARLESNAQPGGICISAAAYDQVRNKLHLAVTDLGQQSLKNIALPVRVYRVDANQFAAAPSPVSALLALPDKPSIAVLPFTNMSGDPEQEYFADGIVEEITTALARFPSLFVIARNSAFTYKGKAVDIKRVSIELGVRYVLEGSVRRAGQRVRITAQLIEARTATHIWAERYDGDLSDVFAVQDQIVPAVAGAIVPSLEKAEIDRAQRKTTESLDAYDLYLRALPGHYAMTRDGSDNALRLLNTAVEIDPHFSSAFSQLSVCLTWRVSQGWSTIAEVGDLVAQHARTAINLDGRDAQAFAMLARSTAFLFGNFMEALTLAERSIELNPNLSSAWLHSGWTNHYAGNSEIALDHLNRALRLSPNDPLNFDTWAGIAIALIRLERDDQAIAAARRAVQLNPKYTIAWRALASSLALSGNVEGSRHAASRLLLLEPQYTLARHINSRSFLKNRVRFIEGLRKAGLPEN